MALRLKAACWNEQHLCVSPPEPAEVCRDDKCSLWPTQGRGGKPLSLGRKISPYIWARHVQVEPGFMGEETANFSGWIDLSLSPGSSSGPNGKGWDVGRSCAPTCSSSDPPTHEQGACEESSFPTVAGVAQWTECQPANRKVISSIPSQGTCLCCRPGPPWRECERQPITVSLLLFLLPFPSL